LFNALDINIIAVAALVIGSITDMKKREVHDYVSYSLIFSAFAISAIYSIISWDYKILINTGEGFIVGY